MIDIHHHCLPGVDDGPDDWTSSIAQCRAAADDGIETIIATPHVGRGRWADPAASVIRSLVDELNDRLGGTPHVVAGSEYYFAHDMVEALGEKTSIEPLAASRYVLVEFSERMLPPLTDHVFYRAQIEGWIPIIAHPERNFAIQHEPALLYDFVNKGALSQITAMSVTGAFGKRAAKAADLLMEMELVHFIATDAHGRRRPPELRSAHQRVEQLWGKVRADALCIDNPRAVLNNTGLPYEPEPRYPEAKKGLFGAVTRFFT